MKILGWAIVVAVVLLLLYVLSFAVRLRRTEKTIRRAAELASKHLDGPLTSDEQAELDEFCRRGILEEYELTVLETGERSVVYMTSDDPVLAELTT